MVWRGEINGTKLHQGLGERHKRTEIAASSILISRSSLSAASPSSTVFLHDEIVDPSCGMVFGTLQDTDPTMNHQCIDSMWTP